MIPINVTMCLSSAVLAVLAMDAQPTAAEPPPPEVPAVAATDPWVPLKSRFVGDIPLVEAKVGDSTGWFVLDTGCSSTVLDKTWATHIGLDVTETKPTDTELVGKSFARNVTVEVGSASLKLKSVWCMDFRSLYRAKDLQVCGALGGDFLAEHLVRIRYGERGIDLGSPQTPGFVPGGMPIPVLLRDVPYTPIVVSQESREPMGMTAIIDTGCTSGMVFLGPRAARDLAVTRGEEERSIVMTIFGERVAHRAVGVTMSVGAFHAGPGDAQMDGSEHEDDRVLIGAEILSQFTVIINYPRGLIVLAPGRSNPGDSKTGLGCAMEVNVTLGVAVVDAVTAGMPADRAGLRKGDVILAVNGVDVDVARDGLAGFSGVATDALKSGKPISLRVRRGDKTLDITIDPTPRAKSGEARSPG